MKDVILQRITDVELANFCSMFGLNLEQINEHQLRIEGMIDFYPKRNRYYNILTGIWKTARTIDDVRDDIISTMPDVSEPVNEMRAWYYQLCNQPFSDFRQGQLTMLNNILKLLLPDHEYEKINTMPDNDAEAKQNEQEKII